MKNIRLQYSPWEDMSAEVFDMGQVNENVAEGSDPIRNEAGAITGWKKNIYSYPPIGSPDSGAYVTARDLDRFLRAVQSGRLLSSELTEVVKLEQEEN